MPALLLLAFGFSGCAALLFQTLWFRQAGLAFGNSVWASSLVLASFMGGLALGNGLARGAARSRRPLFLYAVLEVAVAVFGVGLVLGLPHLTRVLAPWLGASLDSPLSLNLLRLGTAFGLLLVPTTAMGATLPILVRAVSSSAGDFGPALGRLYGWNTLGAVAGAILGELVFVEWLGATGTGLLAGSLNLLATLCALRLAQGRLTAPLPEGGPAAREAASPPLARPGLWLLASGALCGGILLALEVVWFRFLQLFVAGTSLAFAIMLAVVLLGIALGSLAAARWLERDLAAHRFAPEVAALSGVSVFLTYPLFDRLVASWGGGLQGSPGATFGLSALLMLPTCLLSGALFALVGRALREHASEGARAAGTLTLANTLGSTAGALLAGFVLLPGLGVERALFLLGLLYGGASSLLFAAAPRGGGPPGASLRRMVAAAYVVSAALFPFGLMSRAFLERVAGRFTGDGSRLVAQREGLTETILYLRRDLLGEPVEWRLVTNGYSMAGTGPHASRFRTLYVHWPMALRPQSKRALLISYGVGVTARALVRQKDLEKLDVVDISRDILEMGRIPLLPGEAYPLDDPRVKVHVEDGRFHLLTTRERYDLITGEPPPPRHAGVVNLYSQEFFALARERLVEGGFITYWLPVFDMDLRSSRAVVRGFCNVFPDCTLWTGAALNWMLVGSRDAASAPREAEFSAQWRDPALRDELVAGGLETPERLGARFMGDAAFLAAWTAGVPPLVDDWPLRLGRHEPAPEDLRAFARAMDAEASRERFAGSRFVERFWPARLRTATLPYFEELRLYNLAHRQGLAHRPADDLALIAEALVRTDSYSLPLGMLNSGPVETAIARRAAERGEDWAVVHFLLGVEALARRDYQDADRRFLAVGEREPQFSRLPALRALTRCRGPAALPGSPEGAPSPGDRDCALWQ